MKRPPPDHLSSSSTGRGSAKRQKKYSTRDVPWKEQQALGGEFAEVGKGLWPVRSIQDERVHGKKKEYLIDWKPHPKTGEEFAPVWTEEGNVGDPLISHWERSKKVATRAQERQKETEDRRRRNRRVIPDSSADTEEEESFVQSDAPSPPSLLSDSSASGLEIPETQYDPPDNHLVRLPGLPDDKSEFETINTQYTPSTHISLNSPESHFALNSSVSEQGHARAQRSGLSRSTRLHSTTDNSQDLKSPGSSALLSSLSSSTRTPRLSATTRRGRKVVAASVGVSSSSKSQVFSRQLDYSPAVETPSPNRRNTRQSSRLQSPFRDSIENSQSVHSPLPSKAQSSALRNERSDQDLTEKPRKRQRPNLYLNPTSGQARHKGAPIRTSLRQVARFRRSSMANPGLDARMHQTVEHHPTSPLVNSITQDELLSNGDMLTDEGNDSPDLVIGAGPLTIQQSIEDTDAAPLFDSKASSSQESLNNERQVETIDGIMIPVRPILGPCEYAVDLSAEGKVKSAYEDIIKAKRKSITRFISRKGATGTSGISGRKTSERTEMSELLQRLNDTVTHSDLGLPIPQTQYELNAEENAAYAEYAGSKFVMLGCLIDRLKSQVKSIAIFAQDGPLQDLLAEFLQMKDVSCHRHDRGRRASPGRDEDGFYVDLLCSQNDGTPSLLHQPAFVIAFDVSFSNTDVQFKHLREQYGEDLPVIHFLVANSSEHVERCVPNWISSNIRLKIVVRTTYMAAPYLGGNITYIPDDNDDPIDGGAMGMADIQRAVRKSPERKIGLIADVITGLAATNDFTTGWSLGLMPELQLAEFDSPPKVSRAASRTPQPRGTRTHTPASRGTTPVGRKRLLEAEGENGSKRQRLTPNRDLIPDADASLSEDLAEARRQIGQLGIELANSRQELARTNEKLQAAEAKAEQWKDDHSAVLHRYEKNKTERKKLVKQTQKLEATIQSLKDRSEKQQTEKDSLKQQVTELKAELSDARAALTADGGDGAQLELAREEVRTATAKAAALEKTLTSTKSDFEFTRTQYQEASRQATDLASEVKALEEQSAGLKIAAEDTKRSLKAMNYEQSISKAMAQAEQSKLEVKSRDVVIKKMSDEIAALKSRRGVQTRGSSVQPAGSPAPRSRQASPAPGHSGHLAVPGARPPPGSRAQALRNER